MNDLKVDPTRLRSIVERAIAVQPVDVAKVLHRSVTWKGVDVQPIKGEPGRFVIRTGDHPLAFVDRDAIEDAENGVTGGLSTPEGYRK